MTAKPGSTPGEQPIPADDSNGIFSAFLDRFRGKTDADFAQRLRQNPAEILRQFEFVDQAWYRERCGRSEKDTLSAEQHYVTIGAPGGLDPNPLFRTRWYLERYPNVKAIGIFPAVHYLLIGSRSGLRPNPLFDPVWYRNAYPDVAASGLEPIVHYLRFGAREHRNPCENVFTSWLPRRRDRSGTGEENPLGVYLDLIEKLRAVSNKSPN